MIKEMVLGDGIKSTTAIFGSGDIKVSNGVCGDKTTPMLKNAINKIRWNLK